MVDYSDILKLSKSDLYDFIYNRLLRSELSIFPWCEKKYVCMKYFRKSQLLQIAKSVYSRSSI